MSVERLPLSSVETSDNGVTKREPLLSFRPFHPSDKLAVGFETLSVGWPGLLADFGMLTSPRGPLVW